METSFLSQELWKRRKRKSKEVYQTLRLKSAFRGFIEESSKKPHLSGSEKGTLQRKKVGGNQLQQKPQPTPQGSLRLGWPFKDVSKWQRGHIGHSLIGNPSGEERLTSNESVSTADSNYW